MNKERFSAFQWIQESTEKFGHITQKPTGTSVLPPFHRQLKSVENHKLSKYLNPGWCGQSLSSKNYFKSLSYLEILQGDLIGTLKSENFPPKHLNLILNEFKSFQSIQNTDAITTDKFSQLLKEIGQENAVLNDFANYYSARLVMLYFLQLRLLRTLHIKLNIPENMKELLSPPLALNKLFAKGTIRELEARSLETNQYSWYRPAEVRLPQVNMLYNLSSTLSFPDTLKMLHALQKQKDSQNYSHALSHLGIGLLINCLQVNLPKWHKNLNTTTEIKHQSAQVESSLYLGDYLEELAVSHWIAQENNKHFAWEEILCPYFAQYNIDQSPFEFFYHEIQQLQLLCDIQSNYNIGILDFVTSIFQKWQKNVHSYHQTEFQLNDNGLGKRHFDRVILSSLQGNKNNTHHSLVQKIQTAVSNLKDDGYLIVLTNQNLYLPSQSSKVINLFKNLTPVCTLDLTEVKGKGESPDFIYALRKKHGIELSQIGSHINSTFRFNGNLNTFQNYCYIPEDLNKFFQRFLKQTPTIYQNTNQSSNLVNYDFYQSPIINGVQIYSNENDANQITHPKFLKKLLHNTMPLNYFFHIQHIDPKDVIQSPLIWSTDQMLPLQNDLKLNDISQDELILILDLKEVHLPQIHITSKSLLNDKIQEFGISECYYYQLDAKFKQLNIELFKVFINSKIGAQIAGISLVGNKHQVRSKINALLVPSFVMENNYTKVSTFSLCLEELSNILEKTHNENNNFHQSMIKLELLAAYQLKLNGLIEKTKVEINNWKDLDYNTPLIRSVLPHMTLNALYPNNNELNIEFHTHHQILTTLYIHKHELIFDPIFSKIHIMSNNATHVTISGSTALIVFIHFLLKQIPNMKILDILTNVKVPSSNDCTQLLQLKQNEVKSFEDLYLKVNAGIEKLIHAGINQ